MTASVDTTDSSLERTSSGSPSPHLSFSFDCSAFLNWQYNPIESQDENALVFRSLVATVKSQPALDENREAKAVKFLTTLAQRLLMSADAFLSCFTSDSADSLPDFVQSVLVLISSPSQIITTSTMKMLRTLLAHCSAPHRLALVKANIIPHIINTLNPQSLSFAEAEDTVTDKSSRQSAISGTVNSSMVGNPEHAIRHL
ncbi:hypothetical protein BLNAU_16206 [Blattamonas nauphoetae]|uniref:Uncharacterized protein n=1 Tax=Blattamonas nauphoetae TaxID=2049346 RepID=A0ABQ9X8H3_9EUKA|nr:hypothetical protein BLNAU_16206 [Blattamonas nauphoetae]